MFFVQLFLSSQFSGVQETKPASLSKYLFNFLGKMHEKIKQLFRRFQDCEKETFFIYNLICQICIFNLWLVVGLSGRGVDGGEGQ